MFTNFILFIYFYFILFFIFFLSKVGGSHVSYVRLFKCIYNFPETSSLYTGKSYHLLFFFHDTSTSYFSFSRDFSADYKHEIALKIEKLMKLSHILLSCFTVVQYMSNSKLLQLIVEVLVGFNNWHNLSHVLVAILQNKTKQTFCVLKCT